MKRIRRIIFWLRLFLFHKKFNVLVNAHYFKPLDVLTSVGHANEEYIVLYRLYKTPDTSTYKVAYINLKAHIKLNKE